MVPAKDRDDSARLAVSRAGVYLARLDSRIIAATAGIILTTIVIAAVAAPLLGTLDPLAIDPGGRLRRLSTEHWLGTDAFGRDVYSRVLFGARVSLSVGLGAALLSIALGLLIGAAAGFFGASTAWS